MLEPGQQFQLPMVQLKTPISKTVNYQVPESENRITEIFENHDFLNNEMKVSNDQPHYFDIKNDPDGPQFKYFQMKASKSKKKFKKEAPLEGKVKLESNSPEIEQMTDQIIYDDMMLDEQSEYPDWDPDQFQLPPTPIDEARQNCT